MEEEDLTQRDWGRGIVFGEKRNARKRKTRTLERHKGAAPGEYLRWDPVTPRPTREGDVWAPGWAFAFYYGRTLNAPAAADDFFWLFAAGESVVSGRSPLSGLKWRR